MTRAHAPRHREGGELHAADYELNLDEELVRSPTTETTGQLNAHRFAQLQEDVQRLPMIVVKIFRRPQERHRENVEKARRASGSNANASHIPSWTSRLSDHTSLHISARGERMPWDPGARHDRPRVLTLVTQPRRFDPKRERTRDYDDINGCFEALKWFPQARPARFFSLGATHVK